MEPGRRILLLGPLLVASLTFGSVTLARSEGRVLTLSRLPCYQDCPSYRVILHESGKIEIQGRENVPWIGTHKEKGAAAEVQPAFAQADSLGFSGLRDAYGIGCRSKRASGLATLTLKSGGGTKKVSFQTGCTDASGTLAALEGLGNQVDRTALTPERLRALGAPAGTTSSVLADTSTSTTAPDPAAPEPSGQGPETEEPQELVPPEPTPGPEELAALEPSTEPETAPEEAPDAPVEETALERSALKGEPAAGIGIEDEELPVELAHESATEEPEGSDEPAPEAVEPPAGEATELAAVEEEPAPPAPEEELEEPTQAPFVENGGEGGRMAGRSDPEGPARELLSRFEEAYNACNVSAMHDVLELDADTESFFSEQCSRCGGFDVDVELIDWVEAPDRVDLYFEQRVRCRRSRTLSIFDLVAEVPRDAAPWRIDRIGLAP